VDWLGRVSKRALGISLRTSEATLLYPMPLLMMVLLSPTITLLMTVEF
jgi:hypothetical protein